MSAGQPSAVPADGLTQQPGQLRHLRVLARLAVRVERRLPGAGGQLPDRDPHPLVEVDPTE